MSLRVDESQARSFLQALDPSAQGWVFQTFDDNGDRKERSLSRVLIGTLDEHLTTLNNLQARGAGVFVQIQGGSNRGQEHISYGRTAVVDSDDPDDQNNVLSQMKQEMPLPSAVVQSSAGKMHVYWFVQPTAASVTTELTATAADIAGTDPSPAPSQSVMRLPGTWHQKNPARPELVTAATLKPERRYDGGQLQALFAQCDRRGARRKTAAGYSGVQRYDPVFGLPISEAEDMDVLPSGDRTQKLIAYIGKLVSDGYSAEYIEADVRRLAAEKLPAGDKPVSEAAWRNEILPAIARFQGRMGDDVPQAQTAPPPPLHAPRTDVPGLPQTQAPMPPAPGPQPEPGAQPAPPPPGMNDTQPVLGEAPTDRPNTNLPMEVWTERFVWVEQGQYVIDTTRPLASGLYKAADFEKSHKNHRAGEGYMFNKWLGNPHRRTVRDTLFAPGDEKVAVRDQALYYNTYEDPVPLQESFDPEQMQVFEDHMAYLFEDADAWYRMTNWLIFTIQSPQTRIPWAPLLVSKEGTGKTWLYDCVKAMFDGKYTASVSTDELESQYNSYVADTLLICFEEVHTRNKHETLDKLKPIITNGTLEVNNKFGEKGQREIYANTLMTSNHDDALALQYGKDSRRYWVYHIDKDVQPPEYYARLYGWLKTAGPKHLMYWCQQVDQSDWAFNASPEVTEAMRIMIKANMSLVTRALIEAIDDRVGVFQVDLGDERQVEDSVAAWLDQDKLDKRQKMELRHLLRQHTKELRRITDGKKYIRLLSWRGHGMWGQAPDKVLLREYNRAKLAALGQDPGKGLTAVQGGAP